MPKTWRRGRSNCPKCGFNLEGFFGLAGKDFRKAGEGELYSALYCPNCKTPLIPLQ